MKHVFIINPTAGKGSNIQTIISQAQAVLEPAGFVCEYRVTAGAGDGERFAREAAECGEEVRIYACGGDGTVNEVVNGAAGYPNAAVTVVPNGSGNDFAKIFGEDQAYLRDLSNFLDCKEALFDLIACNGRYGINICSVGLDARVGLGVDKYKNLPGISGKNAYVLSLISNLIKGIGRKYKITVGDFHLEGEYSLLAACNGRWYGGSFNPTPKAMPDDGLLDFVIVEGVSRLQAASMVKKYASGQGENYPELITMLRGEEMLVECEEESMINVDGERLDGKSLYFRVAKEKLRFFYPAKASYAVEGSGR